MKLNHDIFYFIFENKHTMRLIKDCLHAFPPPEKSHSGGIFPFGYLL